MSNPIKTPRSVYMILAAGAVVGAIATASVFSGFAVGKAQAQRISINAKPIGNINAENMTALRNLDSSFAGLAEYIAPSVVTIKVESKGGSDMMGRRTGAVGGEGSGVIIRPDGWILTNDHVAGGYDKVKVILNDGREFAGTVRRSEQSDLAVVKIDATNLTAIQFSDSNRVRPGQFAIAIGAPFGFESSVTIGHVSALGRQTSIGDQRIGVRDYPDLIQTDAAINMGNSGGPLLDIEGRVIGINTAIYSGTGGSVGIGFAIPANQARLTADALIDTGKVVRGYLGLAPTNLKGFQKDSLGVADGAYVQEFGDSSSPSPARDAGIKVGDVVVKIGGLEITNQADLRNAMLRYAPGEKVSVEVVREKRRQTFQVKLIEAPKRVAQAPIQNDPTDGSDGSNPLDQLPDGFNVPDLGNQLPKSNGETDKVPPLREGKAQLGVQVENIGATHRAQFHIPSDAEGVVIVSVQPGSVADKAGFKIGDVLQGIGSVNIKSVEDVTKAMADLKWGMMTNVRYSRFGENARMTNSIPVKFQ